MGHNENNTGIQKLSRIVKFTVEKGRFPKPKYVKESGLFHVAERTVKDFVKRRVRSIVKLNAIELDEIKVVAELKTHDSLAESDDRLLNRHISSTVGYLIENIGASAIYIQILDESLSLEEQSRADLIIQPGEVIRITSLQFALIAASCGTGYFGNVPVKMTVAQSTLDEIISKTSLVNLGHFIKIDRENCEDEVMTLYID